MEFASPANPAIAPVADVNQWKFRPGTKDGNPIQVAGKTRFQFTPNDEIQLNNGVPAEIGTRMDIPQKVRVSSGVAPGLALRKLNPVFPEETGRNGIQGKP